MSFCEETLTKDIFAQPGIGMFHLARRVSSMTKRIEFLSAKQPIVNFKGRSMSAEILIYSSLGPL